MKKASLHDIDTSGSIAIVCGTPRKRARAAKRLSKRLGLERLIITRVEELRALQRAGIAVIWTGAEVADRLGTVVLGDEAEFSAVLILRAPVAEAEKALPPHWVGLFSMEKAPRLCGTEALWVQRSPAVKVVTV